MKKIFTLMLALACAMFVGVSCTTSNGVEDNPQGGPQGPTYTSKITITGAPEANLTPAAGELTLDYTIENPTLTDALVVTTEATWVKAEVGESTVVLTYDENTDAPGSPAREAVIKFAYNGAEDFLVTLKQDTAAATFSVEWSDVTASSASAALTSTDSEIDWVAVCYPSSTILNAGCSTPIEYANMKYQSALEMGMPYLQILLDTYQLSGGAGKGSSEDPINCMMPHSAQPGDKLYMIVWGYTVDADIEDWSYDNSVLKGPIHVFEVPLLPTPAIVFDGNLEQNVTSESGSLVLDCTVENPIDGAYLSVSTEATWVTPTWADGKLTLAYAANTSALSRTASLSLSYVSKVYYGEGPDDWYEQSLINEEMVIVVTQAADPNAEVVTFDIQVVEQHSYTHFDRIVVNVTPSNKDVNYVLATESAFDWWGDEVEIDWVNQINNVYPNENNTFKGDLTNHSIILNVANYPEEKTPEFHVYAFALTEDMAPASAADHIKVTVDTSDMPAIEWVAENGLVWNSAQKRYDITATPGQVLTLKYNITNPVEGAQVLSNGFNDSYGVVVEEDIVVDAANQTITLTADAYNTALTYHYMTLNVKYAIPDGENWGIQPSGLRITLNPSESSAKPCPFSETFATSQGDFMINDTNLPSELSYIWKHDSSYGYMKASSYVDGVGYSATSYLASPVIDLTGTTAPALSFSHVVNYANGKMATTCKVMVKDVNATSWTTLAIPNHGTGNSWAWVESGAIDLSAYKDKKIVIAFVYSAATDWTTMEVTAPTWEVKNVVVADGGNAVVAPLL